MSKEEFKNISSELHQSNQVDLALIEKYRQVCSSLIIDSYSEAIHLQVESNLWKCTRATYEKLRKSQSKGLNEMQLNIQRTTQFLTESINFYLILLGKLNSMLPNSIIETILETSFIPIEHSSKDSARHKVAILDSMYRTLNYLGDLGKKNLILARYQSQLKKNKDYELSEWFYSQAALLCPLKSHAYNQLGIIQTLSQKKVDALIYYLTSLMRDENDSRAIANMKQLTEPLSSNVLLNELCQWVLERSANFSINEQFKNLKMVELLQFTFCFLNQKHSLAEFMTNLLILDIKVSLPSIFLTLCWVKNRQLDVQSSQLSSLKSLLTNSNDPLYSEQELQNVKRYYILAQIEFNSLYSDSMSLLNQLIDSLKSEDEEIVLFSGRSNTSSLVKSQDSKPTQKSPIASGVSISQFTANLDLTSIAPVKSQSVCLTGPFKEDLDSDSFDFNLLQLPQSIQEAILEPFPFKRIQQATNDELNLEDDIWKPVYL